MALVHAEAFGRTGDGREVVRYEMKNGNGMVVRILSFGCTVQSIFVPDRDGRLRDVVLGYDTLKGYEDGGVFLGAFVGRYANRIKGAEFELNGRTYHLSKNDGNNHLHGGFSKEVFDGRIEGDSVVFERVSPPKEEGYPGTLSVQVRYRLTEENALEISYRATTDEDTVINLTNHSYFNLNGEGTSDVLSQYIKIDADAFTEVGEETIPTGRILSVEGTPLDLRKDRRIGERIDDEDAQMRLCRGYDHNFVLNGNAGELREVAEAWSEESGIALFCSTTQPGMQFYSGNWLKDEHGKGDSVYQVRGGFCLETQHYPCAPNYPQFPSAALKAGDVYREKTVYRFAVLG